MWLLATATVRASGWRSPKMEVDHTLTPVINRFGMYRTPVWVYEQKGNYAICVGVHTYRYFTQETLPGKIKSLIAMVKAFPLTDEPTYLDKYDPHSLRTGDMMRYIPPTTGQECIGWRLNSYSYILVLEQELFDEVRDGRHTGKKGKEESHRDAEG